MPLRSYHYNLKLHNIIAQQHGRLEEANISMLVYDIGLAWIPSLLIYTEVFMSLLLHTDSPFHSASNMLPDWPWFRMGLHPNPNPWFRMGLKLNTSDKTSNLTESENKFPDDTTMTSQMWGNDPYF